MHSTERHLLLDRHHAETIAFQNSDIHEDQLSALGNESFIALSLVLKSYKEVNSLMNGPHAASFTSLTDIGKTDYQALYVILNNYKLVNYFKVLIPCIEFADLASLAQKNRRSFLNAIQDPKSIKTILETEPGISFAEAVLLSQQQMSPTHATKHFLAR